MQGVIIHVVMLPPLIPDTTVSMDRVNHQDSSIYRKSSKILQERRGSVSGAGIPVSTTGEELLPNLSDPTVKFLSNFLGLPPISSKLICRGYEQQR